MFFTAVHQKSICQTRMLLSVLDAPAESVEAQIAHRAQNDPWPSARCSASETWQMRHANFAPVCPVSFQFVEHFGIDHCPSRFKRMPTQKIGVKKLERAIKIRYMNTQHQAHQEIPAPGIALAKQGVLPSQTIAQHSIVTIDQGEESFQVANIKLTIAVHKKGQFTLGGLKTGTQGRAIALI